jgi:lipoprotein signal peptidase
LPDRARPRLALAAACRCWCCSRTRPAKPGERQLELRRARAGVFLVQFHAAPQQGAAFSFLSGAGGWQRWFFSALAAAVSALPWSCGCARWRGQWLLALGPWRWCSAAPLGNLVDRVRLGYVVDFISVHYGDWYFPTFNIADAAISVGAVLIVLDSLLGASRPRMPAAETGSQ